MKIIKERYILDKGQTGQLDEIYHIQGILPNGSWDWVDGTPDSDKFLMLKTIDIDLKIRIT